MGIQGREVIVMKEKGRFLLFRDMPSGMTGGTGILMLVFTIVSGVCSVLQIYIISGFIDQVLDSSAASFWNAGLAGWLTLLFATVAVDWMVPRINRLLIEREEITLIQEYRPLLLEKCARLKYQYLEQSESWDLISRVLAEPEKRWTGIQQAVLELFKLFISIAGVMAVIASYVWWAALLILLFCIPLFVFSVKSGKINYQAWRDTSVHNRKCSYLDHVCNSRECMNERKLFGYTEKINARFAKIYQEAFSIETKTQMFWAFKTKISGGLSAVAALLIVITLIQPTIAGRLSVGLFVSLVNAVFLLTGQMSWGLSINIDALVTGNEFCHDIREFWELAEEEGVLDLPEYQETIRYIEFRHVSFRYPNGEHEVLSDVSFRLEWGQNYALVGANGAGKTTVIKLLTGLYDNYEGEIRINNKELGEYTKAEQKGIFSVVYQDFCRHALSVRENCEISDPCHELPEEYMRQLLEQFDLWETIDTLPSGADTLLGKIREDGVDLSGGQWQKLAMVRALLRPAKVRILDEPTASLDPVMESEIYQLFQEMTKETLTVLISHRLGFAKLADRILVFEGGRVCEEGGFQDLMAQKGLFYQMYEEQRSWYE